MPFLLIPETGAGLADANSYVTLAEADAYHDARLHTQAWAAADNETRSRALVMATSTIDAEFQFGGYRLSHEQALEWPRYDVPRRDMAGYGTSPLQRQVSRDAVWPSNEVPRRIREATAELARLLLAGDRTADDAAKGIKRLGLGQGAVEIEFAADDRTQPIPAYVMNMLQPFGQDRDRGGVAPVRRV